MYLPATHGLQSLSVSEATPLLYLPTPQFLQSVIALDPFSILNFPLPQAKHGDEAKPTPYPIMFDHRPLLQLLHASDSDVCFFA